MYLCWGYRFSYLILELFDSVVFFVLHCIYIYGSSRIHILMHPDGHLNNFPKDHNIYIYLFYLLTHTYLQALAQ
jgi:hypothetical protein